MQKISKQMDFNSYKRSWEEIMADSEFSLPPIQKPSKADIESITSAFDTIPPLLFEWWSVTNGTEIDVPFLSVFSDEFTPCNFYSARESLDYAEYMRTEKDQWDEYPQETQRDPRIQRGWHNHNWLPIAGFNGWGTVVMIDLDPTPDGELGQVIVFQHDPDAIFYVAPRFEVFLEKSLKLLSDNKEEI